MYSGYNAYDRPLAQRQVTQVSDPNTAWYAQEAHWILIEDLQGGTYGMRKKHRRYLPQEPREQDESYDNRLARSVLPAVLPAPRTDAGRHVDAQARAAGRYQRHHHGAAI
jgi:hypothetical protein